MKTFSQYILTEKVNKTRPVVSVDFQSDFSSRATDEIARKAMDFMNRQHGDILIIYNGETPYGDPASKAQNSTKHEVMIYMEDMGFDFDREGVEFANKEYGFFRGWMDNAAESRYYPPVGRGVIKQKLTSNQIRRAIKKAVNIMFLHHETDSRNVWDEISIELEKEGLLADWMEDDAIYLSPDLNLATLKKYNGCYLIGGAKSQCLAEIAILFDCINVHYTIIKDLVYGA